YYKDHYVLQTLISKQQEYTSIKALALSEIYQNLPDPETARSLLHRYMRKYKTDKSIYLSVNDISSRVQAFDVLTESVEKALEYDKHNAQAHHDFGILLCKCKNGKREEAQAILVRYLHCINESELRNAILLSEGDIDSALDVIETHLKSEAKKTNSSNDYITFGNFLVFARRLEKAVMAYEQAMKVQHDCAI